MDVSPTPGDSAERRKRIDLSRSLASGRKIEKPVKASSKFLEQARKRLPSDEAKETKDEIRSNKREAPFNFFNAYESLRQVYDELYSIKSEYKNFHKFERFLGDLSIEILNKVKNRFKKQGENIIEKIGKITSDPRFNEVMTGDRVGEMREALSRMEQAEEKLGLSYLSKKNKNAMKQYIQWANDFQSFIETINLETLKKDLQSGLAEIERVSSQKSGADPFVNPGQEGHDKSSSRIKETEEDPVNTLESTNSDRLSEGYNEARKKLDELGTLYIDVNNLLGKYHGDLMQVFPEKYKEFFGQITSIYWEKLANPGQWLEQFGHRTETPQQLETLQQLETEKQQLTEISDLCLKIEKFHPVLTPFNQICRYLMPMASSQNTEQILENLNEPSGDSLLVRKIREAFGQDFQEFQKHLQDIDMSIRTMDIISKDSKALEDDTQWLAKKLRECEGAKDQLMTELKRKGFSEETTSELTALTLKGLHGIYNTAYERIQAYMDSQEPREKEMRKVIFPQKLKGIQKNLLDARHLKELDEKELPQKSEDLIAHYAQLSTLLKHFQVLETALSNQDALSEVRGFILYRDACHYQENITRGLNVFQVDTPSTDRLEEISNHLKNDLEQMKKFIQDNIEKLKNDIHKLNQKTSKYLLYIEETKSQAYGYHEGAFPEEFIIQLKKNVQIYIENEITLGIPDQGSVAELWKRYNDLDTARKDLSQALKTYEEPFLQEARLILRDIDDTLKKCSGYVKLEEEGILSVKQDQEERKE